MSTMQVAVLGGTVTAWREGSGEPVLVLHGDPLPVVEACGHFPWIEYPGRMGDMAKAALRH